MASISVRCPHCGFSRDVPETAIPDWPVRATCPKCALAFEFRKDAPPPPQLTACTSPTPPPELSAPGATAEPPPLPRPEPPPEVPPPPCRPRPAITAAPPPPTDLSPKEPAPLYLVIIALLVVIGAAWWLNVPGISAVPDGAHADNKNFFAVKAPNDWLLITPDNFKALSKQFIDKIPREVARMMNTAKPGFTVSFMKLPASETEFAPNFNISVIDTKGQNMPTLTEKEKKDATEAISQELTRILPSYRLIDSRIVQVDGADSLQIRGEAELTVVTKPSVPSYSEPGAFGLRQITGYTEPETQTYKIRALQTMIPGNKRAYCVNFLFDEAASPDMEKIHSRVLESFILLQRPPRFGRIIMGGLNGGLLGAGLYLFSVVVGRLFERKNETGG